MVREEERLHEEFKRLLDGNVPRFQEARAQLDKARSLHTVTATLGFVNFLIFIAAISLYRLYQQRAIWVASLAAVLATGIAVMISRMIVR
jgi:hypothetical protein